MNFTLTVAEALKIQAGHVEWYGPRYPGGTEALRAKVASMTTADQLAPNEPHSVIEINRHIPRGADIEYLVGIRNQTERLKTMHTVPFTEAIRHPDRDYLLHWEKSEPSCVKGSELARYDALYGNPPQFPVITEALQAKRHTA